MKSDYLILICAIVSSSAFAQTNKSYWNEHKSSSNARMTEDIPTRQSKLYDLDIISLQKNLDTNNADEISIPLANGTIETFLVKSVLVMSPALAAKYPEIKTYQVISTDGKSSGRIDITSKGFHGMISTAQGTVYIDPVNRNNKAVYKSYYKHDFEAYSKVDNNDDQLIVSEKSAIKFENKTSARSSGTELRTYRLAVTATGEYSTFHGGTVPDALSAIVTTINRVNGIYERELSIRLVLIGNTDELIYTNAGTDPYTNNDANAYINEVQSNIDNIIGNSNYDIGHGFSTGAGGLAGPGPCVSGQKATGVTGTSNPIGDPYDVDYVAHEIGHQFGANHTFNGSSGSCSGNRFAGTAYEPGSGTTILAYAGICSPQNIQSNSDPYFHTASYDEILTYSVDGAGNGCPTITNTGNNPPSVEAGVGGFTIPINTPFSLTGSGSDPDGDDITFSWEQFDLGPTGAPDSPTGNAPLFRSLTPKDEPTRVFPSILDIINNTQTIGELLPSYTRSLNFRLTVRDNKDGGGGVNNDQISFDVTDQAGPFLVSSFNTASSVSAQSNVSISWDVANTNLSPVNCQLVNILLSEDGGLTFPHVLKSATPNDGTENVFIPDVVSSNGRIKIEAGDNIFFDMNNADIDISAPTVPDYNIQIANSKISTCAPANGQFNIDIGSVLGFTDEVTLTVEGLVDGLTTQFLVNPVVPGNSTILEIIDTQGANGTYNLTLKALSGSNEKTEAIIFTIHDEAIETITLLSPADVNFDTSLKPTLSWEALPGDNTYDIDIATDMTFINVIQSSIDQASTSLKTMKLDQNTTYYWRVRGTNECQQTEYSVREFTTVSLDCASNSSSDVPKNISSSGANTVTSILTVAETGSLFSLKVVDLKGTHTYVSDLTVTLTSPLGTTVELFNEICGSVQDFDLSFDDDALSSTVACPPTDQGVYQPSGMLSDFFGEEISGSWTLTVTDSYNVDGGQLQGWGLDICVLTDLMKPDSPTNLIANLIDNNQVSLSWTDNATNEEGFIIERSKGDNLNFAELITVAANTTTHQDLNSQESDQYFYRIKATNPAGTSSYSDEVGLFNILPPAAPSDLSLDLISLEQVNLSWVNNSDIIDQIIIERSIGNNSQFTELTTLNFDATAFEDLTLLDPDDYYYRLKAINIAGESAYSDEANISSTILGKSEQLLGTVSIYPNPSIGIYTIEIPKSSPIETINIIVLDTMGKEVNYFKTAESDYNFSIDIHHMPAGFYFIYLSINDQILIRKLIKN